MASPKGSKLVQTGSDWSKLVQTGSDLSMLVQTGQNWPKNNLSILVWLLVYNYASIGENIMYYQFVYWFLPIQFEPVVNQYKNKNVYLFYRHTWRTV